MRPVALAIVSSFVLFAFSANAQMRAGAAHTAGGFRGGAVRSGPAMAARGAPVPRTHTVSPFFPTAATGTAGTNSTFLHTASPFVFGGFPDPSDRFFFNPFAIHPTGFSNSNFFFGFNGFGFGRNHRHDPFFGFGGFPFASGFGGGWPYYVDYSSFNYDQVQQQMQSQALQNERLQEQMEDDRARQMEYDQQLADQRAADTLASRARATAPQPQPTSTRTERATPPTVLVYRDQHQVEISSYAITGSTIYEIAPSYTRKIQLSELDIPATIAANEQRGVQFKVPGKVK